MTLRVELSVEEQCKVTVCVLRDTVRSFRRYIHAVRSGRSMNLFDLDKEVDIKEVQRHIAAANTMLSWLAITEEIELP